LFFTRFFFSLFPPLCWTSRTTVKTVAGFIFSSLRKEAKKLRLSEAQAKKLVKKLMHRLLPYARLFPLEILLHLWEIKSVSEVNLRSTRVGRGWGHGWHMERSCRKNSTVIQTQSTRTVITTVTVPMKGRQTTITTWMTTYDDDCEDLETPPTDTLENLFRSNL
jgi:hypothetical protein